MGGKKILPRSYDYLPEWPMCIWLMCHQYEQTMCYIFYTSLPTLVLQNIEEGRERQFQQSKTGHTS